MKTITYLYRYCLFWSVLATLSFVGPVAVSLGFHHILASTLIFICLMCSPALAAIVPAGTWLRKGLDFALDHLLSWTIAIILLSLMSWVTTAFLFGMGTFNTNLSARTILVFWQSFNASNQGYAKVNGSIILILLGCTMLLAGLSLTFGINSSSMHMFYQGRIARTFLDEYLPGAEFVPSRSVPRGIRMQDLYMDGKNRYCGPFLLNNAATTLPGAYKDDRPHRAEQNLVFSPLVYGFDDLRTAEYKGCQWNARLQNAGEDGLRLAHVIAMSASAIGVRIRAGSQMWRSTLSNALNLRLGWWLPNPPKPRAARERIPRSRISLLLKEVFGNMTVSDPFVYVGDGGHFENLGLYKLVKREVKFIVLILQSQDV